MQKSSSPQKRDVAGGGRLRRAAAADAATAAPEGSGRIRKKTTSGNVRTIRPENLQQEIEAAEVPSTAATRVTRSRARDVRADEEEPDSQRFVTQQLPLTQASLVKATIRTPTTGFISSSRSAGIQISDIFSETVDGLAANRDSRPDTVKLSVRKVLGAQFFKTKRLSQSELVKYLKLVEESNILRMAIEKDFKTANDADPAMTLQLYGMLNIYNILKCLKKASGKDMLDKDIAEVSSADYDPATFKELCLSALSDALMTAQFGQHEATQQLLWLETTTQIYISRTQKTDAQKTDPKGFFRTRLNAFKKVRPPKEELSDLEEKVKERVKLLSGILKDKNRHLDDDFTYNAYQNHIRKYLTSEFERLEKMADRSGPATQTTPIKNDSSGTPDLRSSPRNHRSTGVQSAGTAKELKEAVRSLRNEDGIWRDAGRTEEAAMRELEEERVMKSSTPSGSGIKKKVSESPSQKKQKEKAPIFFEPSEVHEQFYEAPEDLYVDLEEPEESQKPNKGSKRALTAQDDQPRKKRAREIVDLEGADVDNDIPPPSKKQKTSYRFKQGEASSSQYVPGSDEEYEPESGEESEQVEGPRERSGKEDVPDAIKERARELTVMLKQKHLRELHRVKMVSKNPNNKSAPAPPYVAKLARESYKRVIEEQNEMLRADGEGYKAIVIDEESLPPVGQGQLYAGQFRAPRSKVPWTEDELDALLDGMRIHGCGWAQIAARHGAHGTGRLERRGKVDLKDKARNEYNKRVRNLETLGVLALLAPRNKSS